jgi:hypothetical protein
MTRKNRLLHSVVEIIGDTPLVELERLSRGIDGRVLVKLEYLNSQTVLKKHQAHDPDGITSITEEKSGCCPAR